MIQQQVPVANPFRYRSIAVGGFWEDGTSLILAELDVRLEQLSMLQSSGGAATQGANESPTHVVASTGDNSRVT